MRKKIQEAINVADGIILARDLVNEPSNVLYPETLAERAVEAGKESPADIISNLGYNNSNNVISGLEIGTDISNIISNIRNKSNFINNH